MLGNYLKVLFRSSTRNLNHFLFKILGLVLGITAATTLILYINNEESFDLFFSEPENLYRATTYFKSGDQEVKWAITNGHLVNVLRDQLSEVKDATKAQSIQSQETFLFDQTHYSIPERQGFYTDGNFLEVLDFKLIYGTAESALSDPNSMVITRSFAERYFSTIDAAQGQTITWLARNGDNTTLQITGILENIPSNSHIKFDYLLSGSTREGWESLDDPVRGGFPTYVYFRTHAPADLAQIQQNLDSAVADVYRFRVKFPIQPVTDIHFNADNLFEHTQSANEDFVTLLKVVVLFIIVLTIVNYVILVNAEQMDRMKENAIRKTLGSSRFRTFGQHLLESVFLCLFSSLIALLLIKFSLAILYPQWFGNSLTMNNTEMMIWVMIIGSVGLGMISGILPAMQLSGKEVVDIFKQQQISGQSRLNLRNVLIVVQFSLTIAIFNGSILVINQLNYLRNKDVGFERELVINIPRSANVTEAGWTSIKQKLNNQTFVTGVGTVIYEFLSDYNASGFRLVGVSNDTSSIRAQINYIDEGLIPTMGLQLIYGRNYIPGEVSDSLGIIVNRAAIDHLGLALDELDGIQVLFPLFDNEPGKIVGVLENFHYQGFDKEIAPVMFLLRRNWFYEQNMLVKVNTQDFSEAIAQIQLQWDEADIDSPFEYQFIDSTFEQMILAEKQQASLITSFGVLSMIIAILGMLGVVKHSANKKRKDIGVKKVFGASVSMVLIGINRYFITLIAIAFVIGIPLTMWAADQWLQNFAYHIDLGWNTFLLSGIIIIAIAMVVITMQSYDAAKANPADVLKEE